MIWHNNDIESVVKELGSNVTTGLNTSACERLLSKINLKIHNKEKDSGFTRYMVKELKSNNYYFLYSVIAISLIFHFVL